MDKLTERRYNPGMGLDIEDPWFSEKDCQFFPEGLTPRYCLCIFSGITEGPDWDTYNGPPPNIVIQCEHRGDCIWDGYNGHQLCSFVIDSLSEASVSMETGLDIALAFLGGGHPRAKSYPNGLNAEFTGGNCSVVMVPGGGINSLTDYAALFGWTIDDNIKADVWPLANNGIMVKLVQKNTGSRIIFKLYG